MDSEFKIDYAELFSRCFQVEMAHIAYGNKGTIKLIRKASKQDRKYQRKYGV